MKLLQCVAAYVAAKSLMKQEMDYKSAYELMMLNRKLSAQAEFYSKEEKKLVEEYGKKNGDGIVELSEQGRFAIADPKKAGEFARKRSELDTMEIEWNEKPRKLSAPAKLTAEQLEALDGFVEFSVEKS